MRKFLLILFMFLLSPLLGDDVNYWVQQLQRTNSKVRIRAERHLVAMGEKQ